MIKCPAVHFSKSNVACLMTSTTAKAVFLASSLMTWLTLKRYRELKFFNWDLTYQLFVFAADTWVLATAAFFAQCYKKIEGRIWKLEFLPKIYHYIFFLHICEWEGEKHFEISTCSLREGKWALDLPLRSFFREVVIWAKKLFSGQSVSRNVRSAFCRSANRCFPTSMGRHLLRGDWSRVIACCVFHHLRNNLCKWGIFHPG